jgi:hypothetical protein
VSKAKLVAILLYSIVVLITAGAGLQFMTATQYFDYHAQASGLDWYSLNPDLQMLILAGFKVTGSGFLTVALSLSLIIIFSFTKHAESWSDVAIPLVGLVFWSVVLSTTLMVFSATGAAAPWGTSLFCVIALLVGLFISQRELKQTETSN